MNATQADQFELASLGKRLAAARLERRLSQRELAGRCRLKQQQINYFETGARLPDLEQLLAIARALDLPLQTFLSGTNQPGTDAQSLALELRHLGLVDLWVESPQVPGSFRNPEEVLALAVSGEQPEARIIEGVPALLAWNHWNAALLRGVGRAGGLRILYRLAWLADSTLAIDRSGGFPGGCVGKADLERFVKRIKKPVKSRWDDLGKPTESPPTLPIWKRWRVAYPADLTTFRRRAESLASLRADATRSKRRRGS